MKWMQAVQIFDLRSLFLFFFFFLPLSLRLCFLAASFLCLRVSSETRRHEAQSGVGQEHWQQNEQTKGQDSDTPTILMVPTSTAYRLLTRTETEQSFCEGSPVKHMHESFKPRQLRVFTFLFYFYETSLTLCLGTGGQSSVNACKAGQCVSDVSLPAV